ncbi:hypothetical protein DL991_10630 [Amycolatopsis sp. WAC 01375]|uniref:hypothetical protein n=1 Tax=Amycolatopsis sp. WAC 01375 TaxID=2203194 RepID=UPI000F7A3FB6|nr:hypothetical protein [Amycolatopsis sp. WAC 01375]RSM80559.1 hypothetical protein DL991_10630 [Amycolatopsis sp. WAC 01375]
MFAAAWWFCEAALDKSSGDAIGIAAVPSALAAMVAGWWAGLSSPEVRDRVARGLWVRQIAAASRAELDRVFAEVPRLPLVLRSRPDVASFRKTGVAAEEFADVGAAFDGAGRAMLLLGAGGGGKSTLLNELCERLCVAEQGRDEPVVPVVVTPGAWTGGRLETWLPGAVADAYPGVSPAVARKWVSARAIVLLVDALEDAGGRKADFLAALDRFLDAGACPVVVACREQDFEGLDAPTAIGLAVQVCKPSRDEAVAYLKALGSPAADSVVAVSEKDSQWWSMVREPLMLGAIATLAAIAPTTPLRLVSRHKDRRRQVLGLYVDALIARGGRPPGAAGGDDARRWLAWLAAWMSMRGAREFYVDRIPASWLPAVLEPGDNTNLISRTGRTMIATAVAVLVGGAVVTANAAALRSLPQLVFHSFVILFATSYTLRMNHLVPGEPIRLTWRVRGRWPVGLGITGLLIFAGAMVLAAALGRSPVSVPVVVTTGAVFVYAAPVVLALTVRSVAESNRARTAPGVRLRRSLMNAWRAALLIGLPVTAVRFALSLPAGLEYAVVFCLPLAVLNIGSTWLVFGGMPVLQYRLLFREIARQGRGPRRYVEFLRWAAENRLLHPAGSAVRFPHREIQRHLKLTWRG